MQVKPDEEKLMEKTRQEDFDLHKTRYDRL